MTSFEGKVVIVTGCASGIGLATAQLFLERQAKVFGIDVAPFAKHEESVKGKEFEFHQADLVEKSAAEEAVARCKFQVMTCGWDLSCDADEDGMHSTMSLF